MRKRTVYAVYTLFVGLPVLGVLLFIAGNPHINASARRAHNAGAATPAFEMLTFVLELIVVLVTARAVGDLFRRFGQPRVVGEMLAGILLGPSVLGSLAPELSAALFPVEGLAYMNALSQLGLVIFMFLVGLSLDLAELRHQGHAAVLISHVSIAVPVFLGVALAAQLYTRVSSPDVAFAGFALFMGAAMAITAFPVLARILADREMLRSPVGTLATACAAVDDVTGWSLLAAIVVVARGSSSSRPLGVTILGPVLFAIGMVLLVRPLLSRVFPPDEQPTDRSIAMSIVFALAAAAVTEYLGVHLLFGAFLAGAVMPRRPELVDYLGQRLETLTNVLLLPLFFAYSGLRTHLGLLQGSEMWILTALIILTAIAGKLGGSMIAARASGIPWREAVAVGTLMNARGLMELVALNIGLDVGVVSPALYSMMVLMALFTTFMTGPLLSIVYQRDQESIEAAASAQAVRGSGDYR